MLSQKKVIWLISCCRDVPSAKRMGRNRFSPIEYLAYVLLPLVNLASDPLQDIGINSTLVTAFLICVIMLLSIASRGIHDIRFTGLELLLVCASTIMMLVHLALGSNAQTEARWLILAVMMVVLSKTTDRSCVHLLGKTLVAVSLVMAIDSIVAAVGLLEIGYGVYNARLYTLVDKPAYTITYTLASAYIFIRLASGRKKSQKSLFGYAICLLMMLVSGLLIMQSKTLLITMPIALLISLHYSGVIKKDSRVLLGIVMLVIAVVAFFAINPGYLPGYVRSVLNEFFGLHLGEYNSLLDQTYSMRDQISDAAISVFVNSPIIGVGFGEYSHFAASFYSGWGFEVDQTESSWLTFLVEGGIVYVGIQFSIIIYILLKLSRRSASTIVEEDIVALQFVILFSIANLMNDFASSTTYWLVLSLGLICSNQYGSPKTTAALA